MTDLLPLRPYQREAIDAVTAAWREGVRRPAVVLPTGMGKTVVFSHLAKEHQAATGKRSVILVHRDELADQAVAKVRAVAPHLYVGKVKAEANEVHADVVVASVQTLARQRRRDELFQQGRRPIGLVITDECHHAVARTYLDIYRDTAGADHVGFTATLARSDGVGLGSVWEEVVFSRTVAYAVRNGFLVMPRGESVDVSGLELGSVRTSRGDYQAGDLGDALQESGALAQVARAYGHYASDRPGVIFTPTVATAHTAAKELEALGIRAAVVTGETPRWERLRIFADYREGRVQVLCNCMVLTEGWDAPHASCAVIARPTKSQPLYVQMVGRVLRPFPGKTDALVLDVVGGDGKLTTLVDLEPGLIKPPEPCEGCGLAKRRCECRCEDCGEIRRTCDCPRFSLGGAPELTLRGTGKKIELLASSSRASWLQTRAGVWFIPSGTKGGGTGRVFLWRGEQPETWDVCLAPGDGSGWQRTEYRGLPMDTAMSWAEAEAESRGASLSLRSASWRSRPASPAQLQMAARYGVQATSGMTRGEVSTLIDQTLASYEFDPHKDWS